MRPFTRDVDDDLPFDDDEWELDHGDAADVESGADDLPDDDWQASPTNPTRSTRPTRRSSMRVRFLAETSLAALAVCVLSGAASAAESGTPPVANPEAEKTTPSERVENRFKLLDADKSGGVDEKEFTVGRTKEAALKRAKGAFKRLDADKSGVVSKEEFTSRGKSPGREPAAAPTKAPEMPEPPADEPSEG